MSATAVNTPEVQPTSSLASKKRPARHGCRFCNHPLTHTVVDLGMSPLCENFLTYEQLGEPEVFYPLHTYVCEKCWLVQVEEYVHGADIFGGEYAYFSSFSDSWLKHAAAYVDMITPRLGLTEKSQVVELASNDGYLLKNFVAKNIPALGIEPAANVAEVAKSVGVESRNTYFTTEAAEELVAEGIKADLLIANNVLAHVPDLNDFVGGMKVILNEGGTITVEFPHLLHIIEETHFDTMYQEHYCYYSLLTLQAVFAHHGLTIYDLDTIPTHGGSLRIYIRHDNDNTKPVTSTVSEVIQLEEASGFREVETYTAFAGRTEESKRRILEFLINAKREGKTVVGYGAPGKGNTLLNYCGVREDLLEYVVDRNPYKHNRFLAGTHIPCYGPEKIAETKPDYILILPWNLKDEIAEQLEYTREWGAQLAVPIPTLTVF
ncbi:class I SAM-dependent methyltransferase [Stratiformator vulcanicus]|uniref:Bifunctional 3-demethylubiquinone-9 3-methyltransferase/ 2-octaprenyl-6-hydroxy phenol methylase n=1 Tax=Stratiformator vulcanicus TaxID=2527980 RepID=A0A517QWE0_9PLAN|nr:class I SAM-dependent methyltransferase [Stratiformator vulcanicus]QDT35907.1 hypothetical protein Pan189_02600 [Stratiformator vulcanicus]